MDDARPTVLGIGEPLVAFSPLDGKLVPHLAGAETNVAVGVRRLGLRSALAGAVGSDWLGEIVRSALTAEDVDTRWLALDADRPTGMFVKDVGDDGEPHRRYLREGSAGSRLLPSERLEQAVAGADAVVLSGLTLLLSDLAERRAAAALAGAFEAGRTTVLDLNFRTGLARSGEAAEIFARTLPAARWALGGVREFQLALRTGEAEPRALAERARAEHPQLELVVVRDGAGAGVHSLEGWCQRPHENVEVVDASGAGDAFAAGLLAARLRAAPVADALRLGLRCAALQLRTAGDCDGIVRAEAVAA